MKPSVTMLGRVIMFMLQFILFGAIYYVNGQQTPCPKVLTIDITDGGRVENRENKRQYSF
jgi:hypothetical protein